MKEKISIIFIILISLFIFVEVALRILTLFIPLPSQEQNEVKSKRSLLTLYQDKDWGSRYWDEFYSLNTGLKPLVGWRRQEFHGSYINIGLDGTRKTWNPVDTKNYRNLFMFGGSALWGTGARDEHTIPSELSKFLDENGHKIKVSNYGESGYALMQEIVYLITLLQKGEKPDYVIFYDGLNDVYNAYQSGFSGITQNSQTKDGAKLTPSDYFWKGFVLSLNKYSLSYKLAKGVYNSIAIKIKPQSQFQETASSFDEKELDRLSDSTAKYYLDSLDILDNLSRAYGFKYFAFWQPTAYNKTLTEEEAKTDPRINDKKLGTLYDLVLAEVNRVRPGNFYDLSNALDSEDKTYFIDFVHVSEEANKLVASKMYSSIKHLLR